MEKNNKNLVYIINLFIFAKYLNQTTMENQFTEKQSLELIGQMISVARNNLQKGMGPIFLLWGYLVAGISLATVVLITLLPAETAHNAYYLWFLMIFSFPLHVWLVRKRETERRVTTYIEKVMNWLWIGFIIAILVVVLGLIVDMIIVVNVTPDHPLDRAHEFIRWFPWLLLTPILLCLYGFALFVSGKAYEFKPLVTGGIVCFAASFFLLLTLHKTGVMGFQQLVLCISAVAGFVIPGHLLNRKDRRDVPRT